MIKRPLYPTVERPPVSSGPELDPDPSCRACRLSAKAKSPCLPADGTPGGLLVVGQQPGRDEDSRGRVFVGRTSTALRRIVGEKWDGPVVYDNVTRCYPGSGSPSDRKIGACRTYLRRVLRLARPRRIIALGSDAIYGLLGYHAPILSVRRGYAWVPLPGSDESVAAFFVIHPAAAARNRFMRQVFEQDLERALTIEDPLRPPWGAELSVIETVADSEFAADELRAEAPWFAYDTEWAGVPFSRYFEITVLAAVSSGTDDAFVWSRRALADRAIRAPLERLLADPSVGKVGHNLKGDNLAVKAAWGVDVRGSVGDTRLRRRLLEAEVNGRLDVCNHLVGMGGHKAEHDAALDIAIKRITRARNDKAKQQGNLFDSLEARDPALVAAVDLLPYEGPKRFAYALVEQELSDRYCARDAVTTARLEDLLEPEVEGHPSVGPVWRKIVSRATDAVAQMEAWGVGASRDAMVRFDAYCELEADTIYDRLRAYDSSFNPASPADVGALLYDKLKLPVLKYTDTGKPSTDKAALARLRKRHPVVDDLLEYRRLEKLRGGYGLNLAAWVRDDGRIHPELKIDGTRTGRLSCVNPPLQTLPRGHSVEGQMIKRAFAAPPGWKILQGDYSQIELRVAAFLSGDPVMISMFKSGRDFHQATAELIAPTYWGIKSADVGKVHRSAAKSFNFALLYGMTDNGLAVRLNCSVEDAARLRRAILGKWKVLARWMAARVAETRKTGYAQTWWAGQPARLRPLFGAASDDKKARSGAENSAINCLDSETEALTLRGWVRGFDLLPSDYLLTKCAVTGNLEWQRPVDLKFWPDYRGPLVEFRSRSFRAVSTPDHRWLVRDRKVGRDLEKTTSTISRYGDHSIHRVGNYSKHDLDITDDLLRLVGWFLTDGYMRRTSRTQNYSGKPGPKPTVNRVGLCQSERANYDNCREIERILCALGIDYSYRIIEHSLCSYWEFSGDLGKWLTDSFPDRVLTYKFVYSLSRRQANILLNVMVDGDGSRSSKTQICCSSLHKAEMLQILCVVAGCVASITYRDMRKYSPRSSKLLNDPRPTEHWVVTVLERTRAQVLSSHVTTLTSESGVWCPIVPNTWFVARRSGHVFITGNTPVQGTASDFMLASICDIVDWLIRDNVAAKLVLTVHDSVIFEVRDDAIAQVVDGAQRIMQSHDSRGVPLKVDFEVGRSLGDLADYDAAGATA